MTHEQARLMAQAFEVTEKFSRVVVSQVGGEFAEANNPWEVELWSINARAGNRNLTMVRDYEPKMVAAITRRALGKATKRDQQAFARMEAERRCNTD